VNFQKKVFKKENLGRAVRKYRLIHGLSTQELSKLLDVSASYINLIENGTRGISIENLVCLSKIFNIDINELIHGTEEELKLIECPREVSLQNLNVLIASLDEKELNFIIANIRSLNKMRAKEAALNCIKKMEI